MGKIVENTECLRQVTEARLQQEARTKKDAGTLKQEQLALIELQIKRICRHLGFGPSVQAVAFPKVEFGQCEIEVQDRKHAVMSAGEIAICFGRQAHRLSQGRPPQSQGVETLLAGGSNIRRPSTREGVSGASLMCGVFVLQQSTFNPLLAAMPPIMHTGVPRHGELHNLSGVARIMAEELDRETLGSGYMVERLLEVFCVEAIRAHIEVGASGKPGWLTAIKDEVIGRSVAAIHASPGDAWSVSKRSQLVSMSPSRFSAAVGESPIAYVTKWRMAVACRRLVTTRQTVDQVAAELGYESLPAFSRAFKKQLGSRPGRWREHASTHCSN